MSRFSAHSRTMGGYVSRTQPRPARGSPDRMHIERRRRLLDAVRQQLQWDTHLRAEAANAISTRARRPTRTTRFARSVGDVDERA
jgi:hypothetical protein